MKYENTNTNETENRHKIKLIIEIRKGYKWT